jgi:two-component system CheB/CheR fusion protein
MADSRISPSRTGPRAKAARTISKPARISSAQAPKEPSSIAFAAFPIVGIGASAGGLEAFTQLLRALPTNTGMAFVLVQHLDPKHSSMLTELLSKATTLSVHEVTQGVKLRPDHIYVTPPNVKMALSGGALCLTPRAGSDMTIDFFMRSLAEEQGNRAIGVVLSGTASDGTLGLTAIKAQGGITFAQDEKSAKHDGMPHSAIASGCVDFVLPPAEIAAELGRISHHPYVRRAEPASAGHAPRRSGTHLRRICGLLYSATGVDFSSYRLTTIHRRIERRMAVHKMDNMAEYVDHVLNDRAEIQELLHDLLIPVTSFFRDPEVFEALKTEVFPTLLRKRASTEAVRIWVPACSTGEEAYSLAMTLLELVADQGFGAPIQIFGTDLSERGIEQARAGRYPETITRDVSAERLLRFFVREEGGYRISKTIRDMCVFARHNLLADPPFSRMDLVSCRNLLIYLEPPLQKKALALLHYGLKPSGFLVLGTAESTSVVPHLFGAAHKPHKIFAKKATASRMPFDFVAARFPMETPSAREILTSKARENDASFDLQKEADRVVLSQYAPAGVVVDRNLEVVQFRGKTSAFLEPSPGRASFSLLKMARGELALHLRKAIQEAIKQGAPVRPPVVSLDNGRGVRVEVHPLQAPSADERYFLISFEEVPPAARVERRESGGGKRVAAGGQENARLRKELASAKETTRTVIAEYEATREQYQAASEELVSANEELQSTNEELETSKEELQSINEELSTVNEELRSRNAELNQVNNDLYNLFGSINVPVIMLGRDLRIRRVTPAASKLLKVIPADVGRPITDIRMRIRVPDLEELVLSAMDTVAVRERELQDEDGRWWCLRVHPYRTTDNAIDGAVLSLLDIDTLKRHSDDLHNAKEFAEAIIETVRQPILVLDAEQRVIKANDSFCVGFQIAAEEAAGNYLHLLGSGQWDIPQLRLLLEEVLAKDTAFSDVEVEHNFPKLGRRLMLLSGRKLQDINDHQPRALLAIADITERKRALEALLASEKMAATGRLAAALSHEINNPLSSVISAVYLLRRDETLNPTARDFVQTVEEELGRISHITKSTLAFYREAESPVDVKLSEQIENALAMLAPKLTAKKVAVDKQFRSDGTLRAFPGEIRQVLTNFIDNAVDALPEGGTIKLRVTDGRKWANPEQRGVRVIVADNGTGIPPVSQSKIFEPFFTTKGEKGTGLGLWVARGIVEKYRGQIRLRSSDRPGRSGTCFALFLPQG